MTDVVAKARLDEDEEFERLVNEYYEILKKRVKPKKELDDWTKEVAR